MKNSWKLKAEYNEKTNEEELSMATDIFVTWMLRGLTLERSGKIIANQLPSPNDLITSGKDDTLCATSSCNYGGSKS